jgi:hypothetical protein
MSSTVTVIRAPAPAAVVARRSWEMVAERFAVYLSTERGALLHCVRLGQARSLIRVWSDRPGQLVEGSLDPEVCWFFGPEFIVSAAEVSG